jgi:hypothetical protein
MPKRMKLQMTRLRRKKRQNRTSRRERTLLVSWWSRVVKSRREDKWKM